MTSAAPDLESLDLDRDGARLFRRAISVEAVEALLDIFADHAEGQAGVRLFDVPGLRPFIEGEGPLGRLAANTMLGAPRPVRAILFDKTARTNWSLGWHQDRVIAVRRRIEVEGFGPWTRKHGALHVAPPFGVLAAMTTLRLHLDPTPATNAPLSVAPGSHSRGPIPQDRVAQVVRECGSVACLADAGDAWLYATPILHASAASLDPGHRRVLQIDYAAADLPGGLEWMGV